MTVVVSRCRSDAVMHGLPDWFHKIITCTIYVANEGLVLYIGGIIVCALNVMLLAQYFST